MTVLLWSAAGALLVLAALTVTPSWFLWQWMLTLASAENGHWLALIALAAMVPGGRAALARRALLAAAAVLLVKPLVQAYRLAPETDFLRPVARPAAPEMMAVESGGKKLPLDFYRAASVGPAPWVVVVHGGGWETGDRGQVPWINAALAARGIAVAAVSYRLAPGWTWPAQREDVEAAVRFLKERAQTLNLDPGRWALMGRSAGGQIAEAVAYRAGDLALKGCVALYAPADLNFAYQFGREDDVLRSLSLLRRLLGGPPEQVPAAYDDASPIRFVTKGAPPTLLLHGERDPLVWHRQSARLDERLRAAGARCTLLSLPWATHGFDYFPYGPGGRVTLWAVDTFLRDVFKQGAAT